MKVKTKNKKLYMNKYMKKYYQLHKEEIKERNRDRYKNIDTATKETIKNNNKKRNIKRYYLHLLSYKYLKQTQPEMIKMFRDKLKELKILDK